MRKSIFIICAVLLVSVSLSAQTAVNPIKSEKQIKKERKALIGKKAEQLSTKCRKEAKQQSKVLEKEGWKPAVGAAPIEDQIYLLLLRQYEMHDNFPQYIIGRAQAVADNYMAAYRMAENKAYAEVASNLSIEITSMVEEAVENKKISATEAETLSKYISNTQQRVRQCMGKADVVFEIYHEVGNNTEFQIGILYNGSLSKEIVRLALENDISKLQTTLDKLLNK